MHALIVRNNSNPKAVDASLLLGAYFASQAIDFDIFDSSDLGKPETRHRVDTLVASGLDLAVALGGDGTILHTARLLGSSLVPVLGINFGHLGFLANASDEGVVPLVARALAGELSVERRTNLRIDIVCEGERDPFDDELDAEAGEVAADGESDELTAHTAAQAAAGERPFGVNADGLRGVRTFFALNEIAVTRGALGRIIAFTLDVSGSRIATMRGDGMVVATATGSTAYALSAGGPLVAPGFTGLITVPLAPHTLHARALLTSENDVVCITLNGEDAEREATLFVDGDMLLFERPVRRVYVRRGEAPTVLLRSEGESFYEYAAETFF